MKAVVITRPGGPEVLEVQERPRPEPRPGEVVIRVHASALNRADLLQRRGAYPPPEGAPVDVPGLEYAGEVVEVADGAKMWRPGDRVMGIVGGGGHAEFVRVHEREAIPIPNGLDYREAAAVPEAFITAHDALVRQAGVGIGERVLVHAAASGVGLAALQIAKLAGATTAGTSRSPGKLDAIREFGGDLAIDASEEGWAQAEEGRGFDVVLDLLGGGAMAVNLRLLRPGGRIVVIGTMAGATAEVDLRALMSRRARIMGSVLRSRPLEEKIALAREFAAKVVPAIESGRLRPCIDRVFAFDRVVEAHRRMEANLNVGKIVLAW